MLCVYNLFQLPVSLIDGYEDRSAEPQGLPAEIAPDKAPNSLPPSTVSEPSVAAGDKRYEGFAKTVQFFEDLVAERKEKMSVSNKVNKMSIKKEIPDLAK